MSRDLALRGLQWVVLALIGLFAIGYFAFNRGVDAAYAACRELNDVVVCTCFRDGYTATRSIYTETPLIGRLFALPEAERTEQLAAVSAECGVATETA